MRGMLVGGAQEGCPSCHHWNLSGPCARSKPWTNSVGAVEMGRKEGTGATRRGRRGRRGIERKGAGRVVDDATRAQILGEEVHLRTTRRAPSILLHSTTTTMGTTMGNLSFSIQSDLANGGGGSDRRRRRHGRMCGTGTINKGAGDSEWAINNGA